MPTIWGRIRHGTAAESAVPIYAIGIGDTTLRRDAVVAELITNEITYAGSHIPIDVHLRAHGLPDRTSTVRLLGRNGTELARQNVQFTGDDAEVSTSLSFEAAEPGDMRVTVALDSVPGETLLDNNRRSVIIRVLENKSRVLLFSGPSGPDLTILRQSLEADTSFEVTAFVEVGSGPLSARHGRTVGRRPATGATDRSLRFSDARHL